MLRIYIETTVWSFALADDVPDFTADTLLFFDECRAGRVKPVISPVVLEEIGRSSEPLRTRLLGLIREIAPAVAPSVPAIEELAQAFLSLGVVPPSKPDDAAHVAAAFVAKCDALVSWNFKHITNLRRADRFNAVAVLRGYSSPLRIVTPSEVLYADDET